jgi:hypothetical protein
LPPPPIFSIFQYFLFFNRLVEGALITLFSKSSCVEWTRKRIANAILLNCSRPREWRGRASQGKLSIALAHMLCSPPKHHGKLEIEALLVEANRLTWLGPPPEDTRGHHCPALSYDTVGRGRKTRPFLGTEERERFRFFVSIDSSSTATTCANSERK